MNPEIKSKWVEALRSGRYKQVTGGLRVDDSYCCLGVLCDISSEDGIGYWEEQGISGHYAFMVTKRAASIGTLPPSVRDWASVNAMDPTVGRRALGKEIHVKLSTLNDNGADFQEIADLIEEHL